MLKESLLAAALSLPRWYGDVEAVEERNLRLENIATAIHQATDQAVCHGAEEDSDCRPMWHGSRRELGFLLLSQAFFETHLALHVHEGKCRSHLGECDGGKATSLWQLQSGPHLSKERWMSLAGTDVEATTRAAYEAARALSRGRNYCKSIQGAISLYATGRTCRWEGAEKRARFVTRLMGRY